jgi:hypothetical protein
MTIFIPATLRTFIPTTSQLKTTTKALLQHDWAPALERFCRGLAVAIALAYASGWLLGTWVHQTSALLGRFAAELQRPNWHQQRLTQLKERLAVRETHIDDPQPALPLIDAPLPSTPQEAMPQETTPPVVVRTTRSKLPKPAPKPTRQRRAKGSSRTSAPAIA